MKTIFFKLLFLIILHTSVSPIKKINPSSIERYSTFNSNGNLIWMYKDSNFNGEIKRLKPGSYTLAQLGNNWGNSISSMKIPNNYVVEIYKEGNLNGDSKVFYGSKNKIDCKIWIGEISLLDNYWDDKIRSVKIIKM